ncbi:MAG TPA: pyridoxamine 5'-phosphate oxidase family protein [Nocardioides sp.]|uniref:pyridoxamine 5'-phosphate oxidase family protein n=1 Tax=Nocardioides sp. TaxID=35761 RepID=UPI002E33950F|nr:pyridoxamine 5'-phosphate oxidase family protein [Nocardioides sp.]HEX5087633.1 pyridoxamine 5'-phosphate oxidase family protein [Nocardioides sp.]
MPLLRELDTAQCERLLRRAVFGRVVLMTPDGPEAVPVNYIVRDDTVVVRTGPEGLVARYADGQRIAFQVDLVDETYWQGWSVVARGLGEVVHAVPEVPGRPAPRPWAAGDRSTELRLAWTELTGRCVGDGWDLEATMFSRRQAR